MTWRVERDLELLAGLIEEEYFLYEMLLIRQEEVAFFLI
jgi:hypothetical protein